MAALEQREHLVDQRLAEIERSVIAVPQRIATRGPGPHRSRIIEALSGRGLRQARARLAELAAFERE